jgi:hypothetical protein
VEEGDLLFCRIQQKSMSGLMLTVLCMDPLNAKSRSGFSLLFNVDPDPHNFGNLDPDPHQSDRLDP